MGGLFNLWLVIALVKTALAVNASEGCTKSSSACSGDVWATRATTLTEDVATNAAVAHRIRQYMPQFDASATDGVSDSCRRHVDLYLSNFAQLKPWALKLYDSTAKVSSGFLNGNVNQLGDFDQCLSVSHSGEEEVRGRYCLASVQLTLQPNASRALRTLHRLLHSNYAFKSELDDPGHRVPRFSSVNWGICVPHGCSHHDVELALEHYLSGIFEGSNVEIGVRVQRQMCQLREREPLAWGTLITVALFALVTVTVIAATLYDIYVERNKSEYVMSFSLKYNMDKMAAAARSSDDIGCVHGIRFINSIMLIVSHKSMAVMFMPFYNRTDMSVDIGKPWTVISRAASLYTDPFIMFSGLLTTYSILRRLDRHGTISLPKEYISRLVRIMPSFGALILFCTWVMPLMSSGPYWNQVVSSHADICKKYWWRNMLFIHNYFGFENMCLTHTHHIGIDTQLFFATPPLALLLWRWPRRTTRALLALAALSTAARYAVTYSMQLSNYVFYGTSVKQLFETADYMYILPAHRATVYIMGILLGYLLHTSKNMALSKAQLRVGWAAATAMLLVSFLGPAGMSNMGYMYNAAEAACYAAFAPIAWCGFFGWVIYTSQLGYKNYVTRWFSWRGYALWTKISYSVYLTQFPIFFYTVGVIRTPQEYSFLGQLLNLKEHTLIIGLSLLLTLFVEFPCQNLKDILIRPSRRTPKREEKLEKVPESKGEVLKAVDIVEKYRHVETDKMK